MVWFPKVVSHWINGKEVDSTHRYLFPKLNPVTGMMLRQVTRGEKNDVSSAITSAVAAHEEWSARSVLDRAKILREVVLLMRDHKEEIAEIVALECGKSLKSARSEVDAVIECGFFFAGEGQRFEGSILPSGQWNRSIQLVRQSVGVGVLITSFNNPLAGIAWKLFPALLCGNTVVVKSHEYAPYTPVWLATIFAKAGLPDGVLSVVHGFGSDVGTALVSDSRVSFISFTGSLKTAQSIVRAAAENGTKVMIETGGKNPFVVCDDANIVYAAACALQGAFVDAGQRCAATSRIIVFDSVYEKFKNTFLALVAEMQIGVADSDYYGAVVSEKRMNEILADVHGAVERGAILLTGGYRTVDTNGYFIAPTVLENVSPGDEISYKEIFGPVVALYRVKDLNEAIDLANDSDYKLSGAIHTTNIHRAHEFVNRYRAGVVRVNGTTHGSEPHVPFGGVGISGNGWREPGAKALDFYSEWKQISWDYNSHDVTANQGISFTIPKK